MCVWGNFFVSRPLESRAVICPVFNLNGNNVGRYGFLASYYQSQVRDLETMGRQTRSTYWRHYY